MSGSTPFTPGATTGLSVGLSSVQTNVDANAPQLRILNTGSVTVFVRVGTGAQTAATTDFPIPPNMPVTISKPAGANTVAAIAASAGPSNIYFTAGVGS